MDFASATVVRCHVIGFTTAAIVPVPACVDFALATCLCPPVVRLARTTVIVTTPWLHRAFTAVLCVVIVRFFPAAVTTNSTWIDVLATSTAGVRSGVVGYSIAAAVVRYSWLKMAFAAGVRCLVVGQGVAARITPLLDGKAATYVCVDVVRLTPTARVVGAP